jgi:hypothetical protein
MTIKQLGGVFGRNPTFNNVTIEGTLTFDGDIDINSDLTIEDNLYVLGSVGIGTTAPTSALTTNVTADGAIHTFSKSDTPVGSIGVSGGNNLYISGLATDHAGLTFATQSILPTTQGVTNNNTVDLGQNGNSFKDLFLLGVSYNGDGSATVPSISFGADTNTGFYRVGSDKIGFVTAGTLRAMLDNSGNLLVGTTSSVGTSPAKLEILGATGGGRCINTKVTVDTSANHITFHNGNGQVGFINTNGTTTAYNTSSDQRLKENIADADDAGSKIDAIQVRKFDWKADGSHQDYGMVAQELLEVAPEAVSAPEDPEEMMGVDYSKLVPMLIKEVQSLRARVAQLES